MSYRMVQKSKASAYFCLYLLNVLAKRNIFGKLKQHFLSNTVVNNFYMDIH